MNSRSIILSGRSFLLFSLISIGLAACAQHAATTPAAATPTPAPSPVDLNAIKNPLQTSIKQNLDNGVIPTATQVKEGKVPAAKDACAKFRAKLPADAIQDLIEVPEDPAKPDGQKIHVFYYGKITPGTTPVVFFNGGPAFDSHGYYEMFSERETTFDPDHAISMIYIDQRGTGCSDHYPQVKDRKNPDADTLQRLSLYGSIGIVADAEAIRKKLIQDLPWIAFGHSYGTTVVHRYVTLAPHSLKSALAHGNAIFSDGYTYNKNRVLSQNRVLKLYFQQFPDDEKALQVLRKALSENTCFTSPDASDKACGSDVLFPLLTDLLPHSDFWTSLHEWINVMMQDDQMNKEGIALYLKTFYFTPENPLNDKTWAYRVINDSDRGLPPFDLYHCNKMRNDLLSSEKIDLNQVLLNECMVSLDYLEAHPDADLGDGSLAKPIQGLTPNLISVDDFYSALKQNPNLPFYWYSGQKDSLVPIEDYQEELAKIKDLPNVHYTNFSGTGHDGIVTEPKVWQDLIKEIKR